MTNPKTSLSTIFATMVFAIAIASQTSFAQQDDHQRSDHYDALANSKVVEGRVDEAAAQTLMDELLFQRATQTYLWAMPMINLAGMQHGSEEKFGAGYNVLPIWKERLSAQTMVTTPNSDVIYAMGYLDLGKEGPMVMDAPQGLQGILLDTWQRPIPGPVIRGQNYLGDVGFFGPDHGKGGKFLILPPGYIGEVPEGYHVYRSATHTVFVFLRGFYSDPKVLGPAVALMEKTKLYPLGKQDSAKAMVFPDGSGVDIDMLPPNDGTAFVRLKELVDIEPGDLGGPDWMGMLAAIGIKKNEPFNPDERTQAILDKAARTAFLMSRVIGVNLEINGVSQRSFPNRQWGNPMASGNPYDMSWRNSRTGVTELDARVNFFTNYYSWSPGMVSKIPGKGANYFVCNFGADGMPLSGGVNYTLHLPKDIPAKNFWSLTLYGAARSSGLKNGQPFPSLGSRDNPKRNADGSTTLYIGPDKPAGNEQNWMKTNKGEGFMAIFRLYSPLSASFDGTWVPGDFEK